MRYDEAVLDNRLSDDPSYYQKTVVVGVQYRVADGLTLRIENHFNHGYGCRFPQARSPRARAC